VPKRNYGFEKRQKEIEKKQKKELKLQRRLERAATTPEEGLEVQPAPADLPPTE
jgi:hypothetical protein